ncbi:hypothetical protein N568_0111920 [Lactococcus garvieae TRF1]|uniref:Uncharacterized protein n=1 Tax=Lactococcus garvieae TRF1 TaxID=1380772 RepID=V8AL91_9LACT|nr:hypothetical protein N568_0111920 [Lactococcus garvieae TRF1]
MEEVLAGVVESNDFMPEPQEVNITLDRINAALGTSSQVNTLPTTIFDKPWLVLLPLQFQYLKVTFFLPNQHRNIIKYPLTNFLTILYDTNILFFLLFRFLLWASPCSAL